MKPSTIRELPVSRETWGWIQEQVKRRSCAFDDYGEILLTWNRRVNLVSRDMTTTEFDKHIRHSLMIAMSEVFQKSDRFVDIGTGGGLPGIPLAMAFPDKRFRLVDIIEKKCLVVREIARSLHLRNVEVNCVDVRHLRVDSDEILLSKHAFKLPDVAVYLSDQAWQDALILKGTGYVAELADVHEAWNVSTSALSGLEKDAFYADKFLLHIHRTSEP